MNQILSGLKQADIDRWKHQLTLHHVLNVAPEDISKTESDKHERFTHTNKESPVCVPSTKTSLKG